MSAGELRDRVSFQTRTVADDGYGNQVAGGWIEQFNCPAAITFLRGTESVMAQRLQGVGPAIIKVRYCIAAAQVSPTWRAVSRDGVEFNIRTATADPKKRYIEFLADNGPAV